MMSKLIGNRFILWSGLICAILLSSCGKDENKKTETCFDGIMNQDETDVDCGGVCSQLCQYITEMSAKINGNAWTADTASAKFTSGSQLFNLNGQKKSSFVPRIQLVYTGTLSLGVHTLGTGTSYLPDISATITFNSGSMNITKLDSRNSILSGTFSFQCTDTNTGTVYQVTDGVFKNVTYKSN